MPRTLPLPLLLVLAALGLAVLVLQVVLLPSLAAATVGQYPELTEFVAPLAIAAVAAGACVQLALVAIARIALVAPARRDGGARGWIDVIIGAASVAALLGLGTFVTLDGPINAMPPSLAAMLVLAIGGAAATVALAMRYRRRLPVEAAPIDARPVRAAESAR